MAKLYKFEVVTPSRTFYSDEVELVVFETTDRGQMGVMADHTAMLVAVSMGTLKIVKGKDTKYAFISEGFIEINSNVATLVVDIAEWCDEIDIENARFSIKRAEEELSNKKHDDSMQVELKATIERSNARIRTAGMMNRR